MNRLLGWEKKLNKLKQLWVWLTFWYMPLPGHKHFELELFKSSYINWRYHTHLVHFQSYCSLKGDHSPSLNISLNILNVILFNLSIYDTRHEGASDFLPLNSEEGYYICDVCGRKTKEYETIVTTNLAGVIMCSGKMKETCKVKLYGWEDMREEIYSDILEE